jgi:K+-transporting ATPase KdpF subunit
MNKIIILSIIPGQSDPALANSPAGYLIGAIVALLIMGYLIYTLLRPDRF